MPYSMIANRMKGGGKSKVGQYEFQIFAADEPEEKAKPENRFSKCVRFTDEFVNKQDCRDDEKAEIRALLMAYLNFMLEKQANLYANQWLGMLNCLDRLNLSFAEKRDIVDKSLQKGYIGFKWAEKIQSENAYKFGGFISKSGSDEEIRQVNAERKARGLKVEF